MTPSFRRHPEPGRSSPGKYPGPNEAVYDVCFDREVTRAGFSRVPQPEIAGSFSALTGVFPGHEPAKVVGSLQDDAPQAFGIVRPFGQEALDDGGHFG